MCSWGRGLLGEQGLKPEGATGGGAAVPTSRPDLTAEHPAKAARLQLEPLQAGAGALEGSAGDTQIGLVSDDMAIAVTVSTCTGTLPWAKSRVHSFVSLE